MRVFVYGYQNCRTVVRLYRLLLLVTLLLVVGFPVKAQDVSSQLPEKSDFELLMDAEADLKASPRDENCFAHRAEKTLKTILQRSPDTPFRFQIAEDLKSIGEILANHNLAIATFYQHREHGLRSAETRLKQIITDYPNFSRTDEVLVRLSQTSIGLEAPEAASYYLIRLICNYPTSKLSEGAFEQLNQLGIADWSSCDAVKSKLLPNSKH